ncbi:MAG: DUF5818 domain-containing protein [Terriglobales bacterium]
MIQRLAKRSTWMLSVLFALLSVALLYGTTPPGNDKTSSPQTVTGCLQKGGEPVGFFITSADGTHWELYPSDKVSLADHVGHTVTVTGTIVKRSPAQEKKSQPYEKKEIGTGAHHDLKVSSVKMVSETCSK